MAPKIKNLSNKKFLGILLLGFFILGAPKSFAQETTPPPEQPEVQEEEIVEALGQTLSEPVKKQVIQLTDEGMQEDWNISPLETYGLKFLVRGKDALTWSLNIEDGGFHNEAIEKSYIKVLTIVNSLFIVGLLVIAMMWMFSILIPRKYLKKVLLVYSLTVIFINFALPINRLFIDGTNILQQALLTEKNGEIQITDIIQAPPYGDVLGFQNQSEEFLVNGKQGSSMSIKLEGKEGATSIGKIRSVEDEKIKEEVISLNNQEIQISKNTSFNINQEQNVFRFLILVGTAIAYFIIALIFILRIVILWALLILSPILLLLAIFKSTRGWFFNWLGMYGRWLLIGPIAALGIAIVVNIWQLSGLPISVSEGYTPELFSVNKTSNIVFYLPGKDTPNTLSNTQEMMEYIIFLIMLYLPIFLAFGLTRQKTLQAGITVLSKNISKHSQAIQQQLIQQVLNQKIDEEKRERPTGILNNFKHLMNSKIGGLANKTMPIDKIKVEPHKSQSMMPTASNFLPENLSKIAVPKMLELLGMQKGSKNSHKETIQKLAHTEKISDKKDNEKVTSVMNEIQNKASAGDKEAIVILHEVERVRELEFSNVESNKTKETQVVEVHSSEKNHEGQKDSTSGIQLNINESQRRADKKVKDKSEKDVKTDNHLSREEEDKGHNRESEKKDIKESDEEDQEIPEFDQETKEITNNNNQENAN